MGEPVWQSLLGREHIGRPGRGAQDQVVEGGRLRTTTFGGLSRWADKGISFVFGPTWRTERRALTDYYSGAAGM